MSDNAVVSGAIIQSHNTVLGGIVASTVLKISPYIVTWRSGEALI
jgi:hypothetical protein